MRTKVKSKKETYFKCKKCGDEIYWNTHKKYTKCRCGALAVDGCEFYIRIMGDKKDHTTVEALPPKDSNR